MASNSQQSTTSNTVHAYRMHVSQKYLDLTRQKLELARLPREPRNAQLGRFDFGVSKDVLEPLIDHWLEQYDWRAQETFYNDTLPQFRVPINGTRLHFVHKRSNSPTAIPLLFVHGWPESFISVSKMIDALSHPIATPPRGTENAQAFHVVAPSIPGFGFSDPIPEAGNNMQATAEVLNALMKGLGYTQYICHGSGWGFRVCRLLALAHGESCLGVHTVNPDVPSPRFEIRAMNWLKYQLAKLTFAILRRSSFGYAPDELSYAGPVQDYSPHSTPGITPPLTPGIPQVNVERPQTLAYALSDSPSGLLAHVLDAIRLPRRRSSPSPGYSPESLRPPTAGRSPASPQSYGTPQASQGSSRPSSKSPQSTGFELGDMAPWTPTALINWAMLYWLPGPEVALRWLVNSSPLVPALWTSYSAVPLGISLFRDPSPGARMTQTTSQWAESYHRIAMVRRREGTVRFAAWERPAELVMDIREFADLLTAPMSVPVNPEMFGGQLHFSQS